MHHMPKYEAVLVCVAHMMSSYRTADGVQRFLIERDSNYYLFGGRQFSRSILFIIMYSTLAGCHGDITVWSISLSGT